MTEREEFEKCFKRPNCVRWSEDFEKYVETGSGSPSVTSRYNDRWAVWQAARDQEGGEAVGRIIDMGDQKFIDMDDETLNGLPVDTKLYTHPPQSQGVPEGWKTAAKGAVDFAKADGMVLHYPQVAVETITGLANLILSAPSTPAAPQADEWVKCVDRPPTEVFSEMDTLIDLLRDAAMSEGKIDTCYDEPNKNPRLATALNWLADFVSTGLTRPQPPEQEGE
ncbi:hypothetical protein [Marinobacter algicola]|uniref:Uncharacterized protein n=1 Tax=Marinobacter algicola DG893 TaxID=443152 RepID=A6F4T0_9GAMM|nr:hypothetical protein [Marinobacter algicola]EDM46244.1 hypothetical protein MDG893_05059 [Marinobacter algicola DG893]